MKIAYVAGPYRAKTMLRMICIANLYMYYQRIWRRREMNREIKFRGKQLVPWKGAK